MSSSDTGSGYKVVDNLIEEHLIDAAAAEAQAATEASTGGGIYSEKEWSPACTRLLDFYRSKIHPSVCV